MRLNRFFISEKISGSQLRISDERIVRQLRTVLRMSAGDTISVFDETGSEFEANILEITKTYIDVLIGNRISNGFVLRPVALCCAILKKDNFDLIVQKATEIGVSEIIPIITERTIKKDVKLDRLRSVAIEATEQSGGVIVPDIYEPIDFETCVRRYTDGESVFLHLCSENVPIDFAGKIYLYVGPEGGWSNKEIEFAKERMHMHSLGKRILRAETAAIVGAYEFCKIPQETV